MARIYVRKNGNDAFAGDTEYSAKLTLAAAVAVSAGGDCIDIGFGVFAESLDLGARSLWLVGTGLGTKISQAAADKTLILGSNCYLSSLLVENTKAFTGADLHAVYANGRDDIRITDCRLACHSSKAVELAGCSNAFGLRNGFDGLSSGLTALDAAVPGASMTLTAAYDAAKSAAAPGAAMDLVANIKGVAWTSGNSLADISAAANMAAGLNGQIPTTAQIATAVELQIMNEGDGRQVMQAIVDKINAADPHLGELTLTAIAGQMADTLAAKIPHAISVDEAGTVAIGAVADFDGEALTMLQSIAESSAAAARPGDAMTLTNAYNAAKTAAQADDLVVNVQAPDLSSLAKPGDKMDLVDAPNATAVAAIQAGLARQGTGGSDLVAVDNNFGSTDEWTMEANGVPIAGVSVRAYEKAYYDEGGLQESGSAVTDAQGHWGPIMLEPGQYYLIVSKAGEYKSSKTEITVDAI